MDGESRSAPDPFNAPPSAFVVGMTRCFLRHTCPLLFFRRDKFAHSTAVTGPWVRYRACVGGCDRKPLISSGCVIDVVHALRQFVPKLSLIARYQGPLACAPPIGCYLCLLSTVCSRYCSQPSVCSVQYLRIGE